MSDRDPLLAILRGLHDAVAALVNEHVRRIGRARESLAEVDRLLREQEQADQIKKQAPPPPIVGSRQGAEELLKLAPIERRQSIIQKLRDLGKI